MMQRRYTLKRLEKRQNPVRTLVSLCSLFTIFALLGKTMKEEATGCEREDAEYQEDGVLGPEGIEMETSKKTLKMRRRKRMNWMGEKESEKGSMY
jgi:hypothetical protein